MTSYSFEVPGAPVPQGSMKPVRMGPKLGVQPNNKNALYDYRARVSLAAQAVMAEAGEVLVGPVVLEATFYVKRPQNHYGTGRNAGKLKDWAPTHCPSTPDLSKLLRALEDGMTGVVWRDDAQVVQAKVAKLYVGEGDGPRTYVSVRLLDEGRP